jgi:hypothetical protein
MGYSLVGSGHIDKGAIYSIKGDSVWATSPGFTVRWTSDLSKLLTPNTWMIIYCGRV